MKRMKALGLCLIAAFALSAAVVATAQAAKVVHGPIVVEGTGIGTAELGNSVANIKCASHESTSLLSGPQSAEKVVATYHGCEAVGHAVPCENIGPAEIQTDSLVSKTKWVSQAKGEVGADFKPESGTELASFNCKGFATVKVFGAIIGLVTSAVNVMTTEGELQFKESGFKNQPEHFEGEGNEHLEAEFTPPGGGHKVESGQIQADHTHNHGAFCKHIGEPKEKCKANNAELNTTVAAQPQYGRCDKKGGGVVTSEYTDPNCQVKAAPGQKAKYGWVPLPS